MAEPKNTAEAKNPYAESPYKLPDVAKPMLMAPIAGGIMITGGYFLGGLESHVPKLYPFSDASLFWLLALIWGWVTYFFVGSVAEDRRVKYKIGWPAFYVEADVPHAFEYNCAQRVAGHFGEQTPFIILVTYMAWMLPGQTFPKLGFLLSLLTLVLRIGWAIAYNKGNVAPGQKFPYFLGMYLLTGLAVRAAISIM